LFACFLVYEKLLSTRAILLMQIANVVIITSAWLTFSVPLFSWYCSRCHFKRKEWDFFIKPFIITSRTVYPLFDSFILLVLAIINTMFVH
jgi:hypothetical protein